MRLEGLRKSLVEAASGHRLVFHHVPKCGGTSIGKALRRRYAFSSARFRTVPTFRAMAALYPEDSPAVRARRVDDLWQQKLLYYLFSDIHCILGHVRFSAAAYERFSDRYRFVTTLREPRSLTVSHFFFQLNRVGDVWPPIQRIEDYLETDEARQMGSIFSYYFSGLPSAADPAAAASIERAKANLRRFAVVGFVDDMAGFNERLRGTLGVRLAIGHANRSSTPANERQSILTDSVRRKIEALNAANIEIYDFARRELAQ